MSNYPNRLDLLGHGHDAADRIHPISGMILEANQGCLSANEQVRRIHIPEIARTRGPEAAKDVERALTTFEKNGGDVKLPTAPTGPGMDNHLGR